LKLQEQDKLWIVQLSAPLRTLLVKRNNPFLQFFLLFLHLLFIDILSVQGQSKVECIHVS
jgi:hypothetical protein